MAMQPKDILDKEFPRKMKGYDAQEVDLFLDAVMADYSAVIAERDSYQNKYEALKKDYDALKEKEEKIKQAEERVMATVLAAQRNAQMYLSKVEVQAQGIMEGATKNAKSIIEGAQIKVSNTKTELMKYEQVLQDYKARFRAFLDEQYEQMDRQIDEVEITQSVADISKYLNKLTMEMAEMDAQNTKMDVDHILKDAGQDAQEESPLHKEDEDKIKILVDELNGDE